MTRSSPISMQVLSFKAERWLCTLKPNPDEMFVHERGVNVHKKVWNRWGKRGRVMKMWKCNNNYHGVIKNCFKISLTSFTKCATLERPLSAQKWQACTSTFCWNVRRIVTGSHILWRHTSLKTDAIMFPINSHSCVGLKNKIEILLFDSVDLILWLDLSPFKECLDHFTQLHVTVALLCVSASGLTRPVEVETFWEGTGDKRSVPFAPLGTKHKALGSSWPHVSPSLCGK